MSAIDEQKTPVRSICAGFLAAAVAALVLVFTLEPLLGHDLFWHLKAGEVMLANREILRSDIFSYTAYGAPWINSEWLSQILFGALYRLGGLNIFVIFKTVLMGLIAGLVYKVSRTLGLSRSSSAWAVVMVVIFSHLRIQARPHMITDALTAFYLLVIVRYIGGKGRSLWFLLPIQIFWANAHGGAIFGVMMLVLAAAGEWLQTLFAGGPPAIDRKRRIHLVVIALLSAIACLVYPWGIHFYDFIYQLVFSMNAIVQYTWEWTASWEPTLDKVIYVAAFRVLLVVTLISFIADRKRARLSYLFIVCVISVMAFNASRFIAQFFIICAPVALANFRSAFMSERERSAILPLWMHAAAILNLALFFGWFGVPTSFDLIYRRHLGFGVEDGMVPVKAVDFLEKHDIHGRVLNSMHWGGYLIFRRWPGEKVHIDGRTPIFGDKFYEDYIDSLRNGSNFGDYLEKFDIDYVLISPVFKYLHRFLWEDPRWALVFADDMSYLYLRRDPKFERLISRYAMRRHPLFN